MASEQDHARILTELAEELAQATTEISTAETITERALQCVPDADFVSLTLKTRRRAYVTLAASNELSRRADELQYALHEGPCVDATDNHELYRSGDIGSDLRWPRWGPKARDLGIGSLLSVRLLTGGAPIGALNFYSRTLGRFNDRDEIDFAMLYATHVAIALSSTRQLSGLQTALHSRHMIGFAQGILSERFGLDIDQSFALLRRYSSTTNTKISVLAEEIARTGQLPRVPKDEFKSGV